MRAAVIGAVVGFGTYGEAQVTAPQADASDAWDLDPTGSEVATRDAAISQNARLREVIFFDVDNDGLDDELATTRPADEGDNHCEHTPAGGPTACSNALLLLKRSAAGWTPFTVRGDYTLTTYRWVGGFHVGRENLLVVELRDSAEDGSDPPLGHSYALLTWRAGALHVLNEGVSLPRSRGPLYLAAEPDGIRFSDARGCAIVAHLRGGRVVVDPPPRCASARGRR